jgi:hypothetical protein
MKTLYESLLDKTKDKVETAIQTVKELPPNMKDFKSYDKHTIYVDYECPTLIQKYINLLGELNFTAGVDGDRQNPLRLKKSELTTLRVYVLKNSKPAYVAVELSRPGAEIGMGVQIMGAHQYCNGETVPSAKKKIIEFLQGLQENPQGIINLFTRGKVAIECYIRLDYLVRNNCVWDFSKRDENYWKL